MVITNILSLVSSSRANLLLDLRESNTQSYASLAKELQLGDVRYNVALWAHGYEYNGHCWWQAYWKLIHRSPPTTSLCPVNFSSLGSKEMRLARLSGGKHQQTRNQPLLRQHRNSILTVYKTRSSTSSLKS